MQADKLGDPAAATFCQCQGGGGQCDKSPKLGRSHISSLDSIGQGCARKQVRMSCRTESAEPRSFGLPVTEGLRRQTSIKLGQQPSCSCWVLHPGNGSRAVNSVQTCVHMAGSAGRQAFKVSRHCLSHATTCSLIWACCRPACHLQNIGLSCPQNEAFRHLTATCRWLKGFDPAAAGVSLQQQTGITAQGCRHGLVPLEIDRPARQCAEC